jgi:AcrR family transcriptional regulator
LPKTSRSRKRSVEILDAAAEVFAQKGYHGASTKDIADRLGIQQAGVYYYFKSKDAALAEVCRAGVAGFVENARLIAKSQAPADEKIYQAIAAHLKPIRTRRQHQVVFLNERRYLSGDNRSQISQLAKKYERALQKLFAAGVRDGRLRSDLDCRLATLALLALCNSPNTFQDDKSEADIDKIATAYTDILLHGIMAPTTKLADPGKA